jgi:outer membrane protein assembly factor BamB
LLLPRGACAYVEAPYTLGRICTESTNILVMRLEQVDKEKNTLVYRKVRDLKGTHPGETIKHNIAHNGFQPREWQNVMAWAEVGQIAVFFHNGAAGECCINGYWYQVYPGDWWVMSHAEPYLLRSFSGKPEKCAAAVEAMLAGQEITVPCMVDGDKEAIQRRVAKLQRLKASLKIQDYDPKRDFAGWGVEEFRNLAGWPGFTHIASLPQLGSGNSGATGIDFDGDGKIDLCLYGPSKVSLLQNAGGSLNEIHLPVEGGAHAAVWADYNGDGKPDLLLATADGPRLFTNLGGANFRDDSAGLPKQAYYNLTAAAWIDTDGRGKPDILLADGFRGLRLYRNVGGPTGVPLQITFGKWQQCGPFDNTDNKGFDAAFPPETKIDLKGEYPGKNGQNATWREVEFPDATLNSMKIYREEDHAFMAVYLHRQIETTKAVQVPISLGNGGPLAVWVNGEKVLSDNVQRTPAPDQVKAVLKLKPGKNDLLIKACFAAHGRETYVKTTTPTEATPELFQDISDKFGLGSGGAGGALKGDYLLVADVDGDGRPDILYAAGDGLLLLNKPDGFVEAKDSGLAFRAGKVTPVFGDFFGDKHAHLLVPQQGGIKLFRNDGKGHFTDATAASGALALFKGDATCAAVGDFTGKGRADIVVGCMKGPNRLFRNNGDGTFTDATEEVGLDQHIFNTRAAGVLDFNRDGAPDVVFVNEGQDSSLLLSRARTVAVVEPRGEQAIVEKSAQAGMIDSPVGGSGSKLPLLLCAAGAASVVTVVKLMMPKRGRRRIKAAALLTGLMILAPAARADWPTSRGNPAHTGSDDNLPGPKQPKVRWVYKAQEHFIASPVPTPKALYISGLGAFNTASFHALSMEALPKDRVLWSKAAPFIKLPTVAAPAVADGVMVFGDGMHQTDGATLYCLHAETGRPLWQYEMPGKLVHLEGAPTIDKGRVYVGGGDAGVVCIDINRVTLEGNELNTDAVRFIMDKKWAELQAKYAEDKKKDGDLAVPPSDDSLPKPSPKLLWQQGKSKWHVDAPVDVIGERLLAASAFVEEDKAGKRVLACLNLADGGIAWETPLDINPWGGPTVAGDLVLVGCSTIRFDAKDLKGAKGQVVAIEIATGKVRWKKDIPNGGVLSPTAVQGGTAVFAATDGFVRAWDAATGNEKWSYDAKAPFFAGPAIAAGVVYAVDLKGTVHALELADGKPDWKLDVTADPAVASPGMVFGSPVVHGGEIFLATNRLEGAQSELPLAVVCLSDQAGPGGPNPNAKIVVDLQKKTITIPAKIAPRKLASLKEIYPLEVVACWPTPIGQKAHETVVIFDALPSDVHNALLKMGLKPGKPARGEGAVSVGPEVDIYLMIPGFDGKPRPVPLEKAMVEPRTGKPIPKLKWIFTGSVMRQPDPDKPRQVYAADLTGTLISIVPVTDETVFQTNLTMKEEPLLKLEDNKDILPPEGTPVELVIQVK